MKSTTKERSVTQLFRVGYYTVSPEDWERLEQFMTVSGDSERTLINQFVRGWISRKGGKYCRGIAVLDAEARGYTLSEWGKKMLGAGPNGLNPIDKLPVPPVPDPLLEINVPPVNRNTYLNRPIDTIKLSDTNYALLRCAIMYSGLTAIAYVSRIVAEHLQRNWETVYQAQVTDDNVENWNEQTWRFV